MLLPFCLWVCLCVRVYSHDVLLIYLYGTRVSTRLESKDIALFIKSPKLITLILWNCDVFFQSWEKLELIWAFVYLEEDPNLVSVCITYKRKDFYSIYSGRLESTIYSQWTDVMHGYIFLLTINRLPVSVCFPKKKTDKFQTIHNCFYLRKNVCGPLSWSPCDRRRRHVIVTLILI